MKTAVRHKTKYRFEQLAKGSNATHKLYVYDEVRANGKFNWETWNYEQSETSAKYFRDKLDAIPDGETIELHVNSVGGEVGEGVTIYNLLRQKSNAGSRLIGYVDGMAYSVAMDIIMACDEIHMGLGTSMFLHNPWTIAEGNADQLRSVADQLDALAEASLQLYFSRSKNLTEDDLRQMMQKETMLAPNTCLEYGFCDFVGEEKEEDTAEGTEDPEAETEEDLTDDEQDAETDDDPEGEESGDPDKDEKIKALQQQLYNQKQINQMLRGIKQPSMKATLQAALRQIIQ